MQDSHWLNFEPDFSRFCNIAEIARPNANDAREQLQPRLHNALARFVAAPSHAKVMRITCQENPHYRSELIALLAALTEKHVVAPESISRSTLLNLVYPQENSPNVEGYLQQAHQGILLLPASQVLVNPMLWTVLKAAIFSGELAWEQANKKQYAPLPAAKSLQTQLIIYGDRALMAEFEQLEPDTMGSLWQYGEYESDLVLDNCNLPSYLRTIESVCDAITVTPPQNEEDWHALFRSGVRTCEDHDRVPLCPVWIKALLAEAAYQSEDNTITAASLKLANEARDYRESYLPNRALEDIHGGHVIIDCKGSQVGQVNGLTVVELPGHPKAYGEPARISCVVHFGDGDISDVERKAEMAGNIHAKGMMIMQAFISSALDLQQPLPYSASIVFEQSYCEVDGDSASLAELCAFVSALSQVEINQQLAITGAVDQFGRVQAVGGINEKIEGFFHVCAHRGLTGEQGVILPKANIVNLCLNSEVLDAIKAKQFHLWPVEDVDAALPLLTGMAFRDEEDKPCLLKKIGERIDAVDDEHDRPRGLINRVLNWFGLY
uniref:S16 family serine protease n=1 Tax=Thaumasiovibrio occultus TaxID=1891184 RepID=UPI000B3552AE|nr:S16 family serine protease [Thaumasiovibrio occultus]